MSTYYVDPAAGGSNNGSSWTDAWVNIQSAFDTAQAGDIVYCRGTQTFTSATQIDIDTNGGNNTAGWIKFIGCNSSGNVDGTRFVIDVASYVTHGLVYNTNGVMIWFQNLEVKNAGTGKYGIYRNGGAYGLVWINVVCHDNAAGGAGGTSLLSHSLIYRCAFYNNGTGLYTDTFTLKAIACSFHDNSGVGWSYFQGIAIGCLFYDNGDDGVFNVASSGMLFNCVIDKNTDDGLVLASSSNAYAPMILGCRVTNQSGSGDIGINASGEPLIVGHCYLENNDGDNIQNASLVVVVPNDDNSTTNIEDQGDTNQGYTSTTDGSEDYNLRSDASLRRTAVSISTVV